MTGARASPNFAALNIMCDSSLLEHVTEADFGEGRFGVCAKADERQAVELPFVLERATAHRMPAVVVGGRPLLHVARHVETAGGADAVAEAVDAARPRESALGRVGESRLAVIAPGVEAALRAARRGVPFDAGPQGRGPPRTEQRRIAPANV